jgi:phage terminase small subunit
MTPRQQRFVDEYLLDLNATQAAIRAGYSVRTAEQQGPQLLGYAEVGAAIQAAQEARSDRVQITQDDVLRGLRREATLIATDHRTP